MPSSVSDEPAVVVGRAYDFTLWLLPKAEKFPRSYRFSVGDRLVASTLDLLLLLVEASYTARKAHLLQQAVGVYICARTSSTNSLRTLSHTASASEL